MIFIFSVTFKTTHPLSQEQAMEFWGKGSFNRWATNTYTFRSAADTTDPMVALERSKEIVGEIVRRSPNTLTYTDIRATLEE